jgi:hypothetical protein
MLERLVPVDLHFAYPRAGWSALAPAHDVLNRWSRPFEYRFDGA